MTVLERQLLLKDLCARLPYGVIVEITSDGGMLEASCNMRLDAGLLADLLHSEDDFKPYLRPMSSMTKEEIDECYWLQQGTIHVNFYMYEEGYEKSIDLPYFELLVDFYHSHHLDYRGFIEKGLALEAYEGLYKTE